MNKNKQGGTTTLIKIAFRNIWRNKRRTVFCLLAVGIAVFFILIYSSMIDGMTDSINQIVQIFELGHIRIVSEIYEAEQEYLPVQYPIENGSNWRDIADSIKEISGVKAVFPRINTMASLQESTIKHAILWGINIEEEMSLNNFNLTERNNGLIEGRYPDIDANEIAIGHVFSNKTGLSIGDRIPLRTASAHFSDRFWSPVITGIYNFDYIKFDENYIVADFSRLQRLLGLETGTQQLIVFTENDKYSASIASMIRDVLTTDSIVTEWTDNYWVSMMKMIIPIYTLVFLVFLIVASFLIINTVVMIIHERIKEIGMMGSLGMTRFEIIKVFFFESLFLSIFGACLGVLIGGSLVGFLANYPFRLGDMYGNTFSDMPMSNAIFFSFSYGRLIMAWLMGVGVASIFTLIPSLKSAFIEPVEALKR